MTGTPLDSAHPRRLLALLAEDTHISALDAADAEAFLTVAGHYANDRGIVLNDVRRLALAAHGLAFVRRVRAHEYPPELDRALYDEVGAELFAGVRELLDAYCAGRAHTVSDTEVLLLTLHFEAALQEDVPEPGRSV
ncbi:hypothetical protein [Streptomyces sp. NBC_01012]|uniref:hypothetical protein n=1 Tax=Streptomyces sp. NBC_01012 TaxID=2903717 RepID=UPI0038689B45|nr:hypothetical protein OG623_18035 [Streptomyces sp. NBC_01012]